MNPSALAITFLTCAFLAMTEAQVPKMQPRCHCTSTKVEQEISNDRILKMEVFQPGPHCSEKEVIALVKFRKEVKLCLNPKDKWVQKALKRRNLAL